MTRRAAPPVRDLVLRAGAAAGLAGGARGGAGGGDRARRRGGRPRLRPLPFCCRARQDCGRRPEEATMDATARGTARLLARRGRRRRAGTAATRRSTRRSATAGARSGSGPRRRRSRVDGGAELVPRARHPARPVPAQHVPRRAPAPSPATRAALAVAQGRDPARPRPAASALPERQFFYMPLMHSEIADQPGPGGAAVPARTSASGELLRHARAHREIIRRFGRFPFRNAALGRESTPEEVAFLAEGGYRGDDRSRLAA